MFHIRWVSAGLLFALLGLSGVNAQDFGWVRQLAGTSSVAAEGVALDSGGNIYTVGWFLGAADFDPGGGVTTLTSTSGSIDAYISKLDSAGNFVWARQLAGPNIDEATDVALDSGGNLYTVGTFNATLDLDPGPGTVTLTSAGGQDAYVSKLDGAGNFVWASQLSGTDTVRAFGVALDSGGNVYVVGDFRSTADFDPGPGTSNLTSFGVSDVFVVKLDSAGNLAWVRQLGGTSTDSGSSVTLDSSGNIYTVGDFRDTADFDPGPGTANLTHLAFFLTSSFPSSTAQEISFGSDS